MTETSLANPLAGLLTKAPVLGLKLGPLFAEVAVDAKAELSCDVNGMAVAPKSTNAIKLMTHFSPGCKVKLPATKFVLLVPLKGDAGKPEGGAQTAALPVPLPENDPAIMLMVLLLG